MDQKLMKALDRTAALVPALAGLAALVWFLVRVIPKPSRARYPCMQAAAPLASSFVIGLLSLGTSALIFRKARGLAERARTVRGRSLALGLCAAAGLACAATGLIGTALPASAAARPSSVRFARKLPNDGPNMPMGEGKGIFPGRVVWAHDPAAVNQRYPSLSMKSWYDEANAKQKSVDAMFSKGLMSLTGSDAPEAAWDRLFRDFNKSRGRGDRGYEDGETIFVKININGLGNEGGRRNIDTSPQVLHALLGQLVVRAGVPQDRIYVGDPNIPFDGAIYRSILEDFPGVGILRRGMAPPTPRDIFFASDGRTSDPLPQAYADAAYLVNVPVLKKHHRAGISLTAKLHFGSVSPYNPNGAFNWHYGLPAPQGTGLVDNGEYGVYRCLVDFMGHEDLGGKTILYLVDGLWSSINWGHPAKKWRMTPFDGQYPSSIFLSQDPVAIESVGYDFLYAEYDEKHPTEGGFDPRDNSGPFARYAGVDDYLHQAADPRNWPAGLTYDPERDGTPLGSLGTHEHWNDAVEKKYSRNLGKDAGIELVYVR